LCAAYDRLGWRATKLLDIMCEDLVRGEPQTYPLTGELVRTITISSGARKSLGNPQKLQKPDKIIIILKDQK